MNEPTHVDLFSGIGGFALAAKWAGFRTIAFCEIDKYCQKVLAKNFLSDASRIQQGRKIERPKRERTRSASEPVITGDIFEFDGTQFRTNGSSVTLVTGGFPCQPFSVAGKQRGAEDDRHLWPEMLRVITQARPAWVLGENVPGIIPMELDNVLSDLESIGYATRPFVIPACAVDARHRRDRLWIICRDISNSDSSQHFVRRTSQQWKEPSESYRSHLRKSSDTERTRSTRTTRNRKNEFCSWEPEPDVGRVAHGIPNRVDRLKGLGNAIVPQVAYEILKEIRNLI